LITWNHRWVRWDGESTIGDEVYGKLCFCSWQVCQSRGRFVGKRASCVC
jgi:hypothetical protein